MLPANQASTDKIRTAYLRSMLSQADIARRMEVSDVTVYRYVTGLRKPSAKNLPRLAAALNVPVADLLSDAA